MRILKAGGSGPILPEVSIENRLITLQSFELSRTLIGKHAKSAIFFSHLSFPSANNQKVPVSQLNRLSAVYTEHVQKMTKNGRKMFPMHVTLKASVHKCIYEKCIGTMRLS